MGAGMVVLPESMIEDDLGLLRCREPLRIEDFPAERAFESLVVSVRFVRRNRLEAGSVDL